MIGKILELGVSAPVTRSTFPNQLVLFGRFWRPWRPHPSQVAHHGSTTKEHISLRRNGLQPSRVVSSATRPWRPSQIGASGPRNLEPASEIYQPDPSMNEQRIEILTELIPSDAAYLARIPRTLSAMGVPAEVDIHSTPLMTRNLVGTT
jgi:hypothetical protein